MKLKNKMILLSSLSMIPALAISCGVATVSGSELNPVSNEKQILQKILEVPLPFEKQDYSPYFYNKLFINFLNTPENRAFVRENIIKILETQEDKSQLSPENFNRLGDEIIKSDIFQKFLTDEGNYEGISTLSASKFLEKWREYQTKNNGEEKLTWFFKYGFGFFAKEFPDLSPENIIDRLVHVYARAEYDRLADKNVEEVPVSALGISNLFNQYFQVHSPLESTLWFNWNFEPLEKISNDFKQQYPGSAFLPPLVDDDFQTKYDLIQKLNQYKQITTKKILSPDESKLNIPAPFERLAGQKSQNESAQNEEYKPQFVNQKTTFKVQPRAFFIQDEQTFADEKTNSLKNVIYKLFWVIDEENGQNYDNFENIRPPQDVNDPDNKRGNFSTGGLYSKTLEDLEKIEKAQTGEKKIFSVSRRIEIKGFLKEENKILKAQNYKFNVDSLANSQLKNDLAQNFSNPNLIEAQNKISVPVDKIKNLNPKYQPE
ncbi:Uncharacterised protein [Mesomycoplasma conjunctivae]|nr:hypothetical protein [Mesomycoplasma conjunctivae]VEU66115.1 Uncharacterised protein [Mesomycoplasma conjunctivae]